MVIRSPIRLEDFNASKPQTDLRLGDEEIATILRRFVSQGIAKKALRMLTCWLRGKTSADIRKLAQSTSATA